MFLAILSGLLTGLSFSSPYLSCLCWLSFLPIFFLVNKVNFKKTLIYGLIFGISFYLTILFWLCHVTCLGLLVLVLYLSIYPILFFLGWRYFFNKRLALFTIPALWIVLEFIKENIWCGFSWANLGYSQYQMTKFIQIADIFGVKIISFLIILVNIAIFKSILKPKQIMKYALIVLVLIASSILYSFKQIKANDQIDISVIQPNIPQELKWQDFNTTSTLSKLKSLAKETNTNSFVVFPESSWPELLDKERQLGQVKDFFKEINRDGLIGIVLSEGNYYYNCALEFNRQGELIDLYRKIKLVPFGEYIPLRKFLSFIPVINLIGDMSRGDEYKVFNYKDKKFSVLICFEDVSPSHVAKFARSRDFLINITNDAWFKGQPQANQHLAIMTFRAIENRISIVRAANTGISGWVSFRGEIFKLKKDNKAVAFEGVSNFTLAINSKRSFYNLYGEIFPLICIGFLLIMVKGGFYARPRI